MYKLIVYSDELYHYGVKGMRWGVRRYQNYDGTRIGTGGAPITNPAKTAKDSVALGQGGKAKSLTEKLAAASPGPTNGKAKKIAEVLTDDSVKVGKGKDNISPLEDATRDVGKLTESGKKLTDYGKKYDPKVKEAGEKASEEAKGMSDQELREKISRIKMEREYKSLKESEVSSGWDKASEILDVAGDILQIMGTLASLYLTYKLAKGKIGIGQSAIDEENELKSFMKANDFDEEVIAHFMNLDDEYVGDYLEHHGVKGMRWGVRRYQNYDGTRIGTGSGAGGGGGGSHRIDSNPSFSKKRRKEIVEQFKKSIAGGQGGKAEGNSQLAAKAPVFGKKTPEDTMKKDIDGYGFDKKIKNARENYAKELILPSGAKNLSTGKNYDSALEKASSDFESTLSKSSLRKEMDQFNKDFESFYDDVNKGKTVTKERYNKLVERSQKIDKAYESMGKEVISRHRDELNAATLKDLGYDEEHVNAGVDYLKKKNKDIFEFTYG